MLSTILSDAAEKFKQTLEIFQREIAVIRAGRANPSLVEDISVEAYGTKLTVKEVATISAPEATLLTISPWDKTVLPAIAAAIRNADLGLNPLVEVALIRVPVPSLSEERRVEMAKKVSRLAEEARVKIRQIRHEKIKSGEEMEEAGDVSEDNLFRFKEGLQKEVDKANAQIDTLKEKKEAELQG